MLHSYKVSYFPPYEDGFEITTSSIDDTSHPDHVVSDFNKNVVRNVAIYGLNDSGKTRFVDSLSLLRDLILGSNFNSKLEELFKNLFYYKSSSARYEIQFTNNGHFLTYVLYVSSQPTINEYLYVRIDNEDKLVFSNDSNGIRILKESNNDWTYRKMESDDDSDLHFYLHDHSSNYSQIFRTLIKDTKNHPKNYDEIISNWNQYICDAIEWFQKITILSPDDSKFIKKDLDFMSDILHHFDTGITKIQSLDVTEQYEKFLNEFHDHLSSLPPDTEFDALVRDYTIDGSQIGVLDSNDGNRIFIVTAGKNLRAYKLLFYHEGIEEPLEWFQESDGTLRLLEFYELLYDSDPDALFVIDEFDRKLHPLATQELLKLFNQKTERRQQLIFTTHESSLISSDFLRDDEIRFITKSKDNVSKIHSVVGHNEYIYAINEKSYLEGEYDHLFYGGGKR